MTVKEWRDNEALPVSNLIVNLYLSEKKKYNAATGEGWMCNLVTNQNGEGIFQLTPAFYELMANTHTFRFIASIGSDPVYAETEQELIVKDVLIDLKVLSDNLQTSVVASLFSYSDAVRTVLPGRELTLYAKRNSSMVPLHKKPGLTDKNGELKVLLPAILLKDKNIRTTLVARYIDAETRGLTEVSQELSSNVSGEEKRSEPSFWAWGRNYWQRTVIVIISLFILFMIFFKKKKPR